MRTSRLLSSLRRRRLRRRRLADAPDVVVLALFAIASGEAAWFYHGFDRYGWPLLDAINALPLRAWWQPKVMLALAVLLGISFAVLGWTMIAAEMLDEIKRRRRT